MTNPILIMKNAGYGETPVPDDALVQPGDTFIVWSKESDGLRKVECECLAVVPVGVPIEYAMADQSSPPKPRPIMLREESKPRTETVYVLQRETDDQPTKFRHSQLLAGADEFEETRPDIDETGKGDQ